MRLNDSFLAGQALLEEEADVNALWRSSPEHAGKWQPRKILANHAGLALVNHSQDAKVIRIGEAMLECGKSQIYEQHEHGMKLKRAYLCHRRGCPICDKLLADARRHDMEDRIPGVLEKDPEIIKIPLLLTVTVKNCKVNRVRATLAALKKAWASMIHSSKGLLGPWLAGAIVGYEVTRGKDGNAHPHLHAALYLKKGYFKGNKPAVRVEEVAAEVKRVMCLDYIPHCSMNHAVRRNDEKNAIGAALEAVKYCVKPSKDVYTDGSFFAELIAQLRSLRLVESTGSFRGLFRDNFLGDEVEIQEEAEMRRERREAEKNKVSLENSIGDPTGKRAIVCWRKLSPLIGYYRINRIVDQSENGLYVSMLEHSQMSRICDQGRDAVLKLHHLNPVNDKRIQKKPWQNKLSGPVNENPF